MLHAERNMRFDVCRKSRLARAATSQTLAWRSKFPVACERNFELHLLKERLKTIISGAETSIPRKKAGLSMGALRAALVPDNSEVAMQRRKKRKTKRLC